MADGRYWDHVECGWAASPGAPDALATPWSAHGITVTRKDGPKDAADLLRLDGDDPVSTWMRANAAPFYTA